MNIAVRSMTEFMYPLLWKLFARTSTIATRSGSRSSGILASLDARRRNCSFVYICPPSPAKHFSSASNRVVYTRPPSLTSVTNRAHRMSDDEFLRKDTFFHTFSFRCTKDAPSVSHFYGPKKKNAEFLRTLFMRLRMLIFTRSIRRNILERKYKTKKNISKNIIIIGKIVFLELLVL